MKRHLAILFAAASLSNLAAGAQGLMDRTEAACKEILASAPQPPVDAAAASLSPDCDSAASYFGIGRQKDFIAARHCAMKEREHPSETDSNIFAGPGVLSMVYANGEGVLRDTKLARRFVCENGWGAAAEVEFRLDLLKQIDTAGSIKPPHFDLCDTATSGLSQGWCESIDSRLSDVKRDHALKAYQQKLPGAALVAFEELRAAQTAFEKLRVDGEVDLSGTGRAAFEFEEQTDLRDQFLKDLIAVLSLLPPAKLTPAQSDSELNAAYAALRKRMPADEKATQTNFDFGTLNFADTQKAERAWLPLRAAWLAFYEALHPGASKDPIYVRVTLARLNQLKALNAE